MKSVKVTYRVRPEFVEQNKKNIQAVMDYLKDNPIEGMYYSSYQLDDEGLFMHINVAQDEVTMNKLNDVKAFMNFRMQLKASAPVESPKAQKIELVGAGWKM
jgi:BarA-like signal transduction histidine kinase